MDSPDIIEIATTSAPSVREREETSGALVYTLPGRGIDGKAQFFNAVKETLPLDPSLGTGLVWDALSDSLYGGLSNVEAPRVALIWPNAASMRTKAPKDYQVAVSVLRQVAQQLKSPSTSPGYTKVLTIYIA
jgi:RNAse (barnase) inhibitor barstar